MGLTLVTAPTREPLTLPEAKLLMRVEETADDDLVKSLIPAARQHIEDFTGRALVTQTWEWKADSWRDVIGVRCPMPPWRSVVSITYIDSAGATQTWAQTEYQVDLDPNGARIALAYGKTLPSLRGGDLNAVTVRFVAGYGDPESVPEPIRHAMALLISHWYHERRPVGVAQLAEMPFQVSALLMPFKVWGFGA